MAIINDAVFSVLPPDRAPHAELTSEQRSALHVTGLASLDVFERVAEGADLASLAELTRVMRERNAPKDPEDDRDASQPTFFAKKAQPHVTVLKRSWRADTRTALLGMLELQRRMDVFGVKVVGESVSVARCPLFSSRAAERAPILNRYVGTSGRMPYCFDDVIPHVAAMIEREGSAALEQFRGMLEQVPEGVVRFDNMLTPFETEPTAAQQRRADSDDQQAETAPRYQNRERHRGGRGRGGVGLH